MITMLHPPGLKTAVRGRVEYERAEKDPDQVIRTVNCLKTEWQKFEKYEADRKEVSLRAAGKGNARRGGKQ